MSLHLDPDCAGEWEAERDPPRRYWRCTECERLLGPEWDMHVAAEMLQTLVLRMIVEGRG